MAVRAPNFIRQINVIHAPNFVRQVYVTHAATRSNPQVLHVAQLGHAEWEVSTGRYKVHRGQGPHLTWFWSRTCGSWFFSRQLVAH